MFRKSAVLTGRKAFVSKAAHPAIVISPERTVLHGHALLEHAIAQGDTNLVKQIIQTRWINLSRPDFHNHTLTVAEFAELHGHPEIIALFKKSATK